MSAWQAYNYLGRLLYPLKILAQHKISVSPLEIPCCFRSYGKLTFVIESCSQSSTGQDKAGFSHSLPPAVLRRCPSASQVSLQSGTLPWFLEDRAQFPPSTTTQCLSSAPYHGPVLHCVGFWDQSWGSLAKPCSWEVHPSCGWQKLRISSLLWLGCCDIGGDIMSGSSASCLQSNPKQVFPSWMLSPGRQNGGDCFLAGSFVVCTWEQVYMNIFFVFVFLSAVPSFLLPSLQSLFCFCLLLSPCLCLGFCCCYHIQAGPGYNKCICT